MHSLKAGFRAALSAAAVGVAALLVASSSATSAPHRSLSQVTAAMFSISRYRLMVTTGLPPRAQRSAMPEDRLVLVRISPSTW